MRTLNIGVQHAKIPNLFIIHINVSPLAWVQCVVGGLINSRIVVAVIIAHHALYIKKSMGVGAQVGGVGNGRTLNKRREVCGFVAFRIRANWAQPTGLGVSGALVWAMPINDANALSRN